MSMREEKRERALRLPIQALRLPIQALRLVISTYEKKRGEEPRRPAASGNLGPALSRLRRCRCIYSGSAESASPIRLRDPATRNCAHNLRAGSVAAAKRRIRVLAWMRRGELAKGEREGQSHGERRTEMREKTAKEKGKKRHKEVCA